MAGRSASSSTIWRRCAVCTAALGRGGDLALPDSFTDFALGEAARADTDAGHEAEQYWLQRFGGAVPSLDLPVDHPRPRRRGFTSKREDRTLDAALVAEIKRMGARRGASFYATLLAAFGVHKQQTAGAARMTW